MSGEATQSTEQGWHVDSWPPLAWLETAIKLVAIIIGVVALAQALSGGTLGLPSGITLVQWIILVILSLGLVVAILDRLREREIVATAFALLSNPGHGAWSSPLLVSLGRAGCCPLSRR